MIRIENIELKMKVLTQSEGIGIVKDLSVSDGNRIYALIELENGKTMSFPIDRLVKWESETNQKNKV